MDTIAFRLKAHPGSDETDFLVVEVYVNETVLTDFGYYATDLYELLRSADTSGNFYIITCWCGMPDCAGIRQGIDVRHVHRNVFWHMIQPQPERRFVFAQTQYQQAIQQLLKTAKRHLAYRQDISTGKFEITPDRNEGILLAADDA